MHLTHNLLLQSKGNLFDSKHVLGAISASIMKETAWSWAMPCHDICLSPISLHK